MICPVEIASEMSAFQAARVEDHGEHVLYTKAAMERLMKVQEVILLAMSRVLVLNLSGNTNRGKNTDKKVCP
jgi:hypothetical protein